MPKVIQRIEVLEERLRQLKAKQQRIDARRRALETRQSRKADVRRKILAGAIVLAKVEDDAAASAQIRQWLDEALVREDDRALFGLPPVPQKNAAESRPLVANQGTKDASAGKQQLSADGPS